MNLLGDNKEVSNKTLIMTTMWTILAFVCLMYFLYSITIGQWSNAWFSLFGSFVSLQFAFLWSSFGRLLSMFKS